MTTKQQVVPANGMAVVHDVRSPSYALLADNLLPMIERLANDERRVTKVTRRQLCFASARKLMWARYR
jgi:hypothetical protein